MSNIDATEKSKKALEVKLDSLNFTGKRKEGIVLLRKYLARYQETNHLLLRLAFFLYHHAITLKKDTKLAQEEFHEAKKILDSLLERNTLSKNSVLNARLFLAQIYAFLGEGKKAIQLAKSNFRTEKDILTANRLGNIYDILGDIDNAFKWYRYCIKKAKSWQDTVVSFETIGNFYTRKSKYKIAEDYLKIAVDSFPPSARTKNNLWYVAITKRYKNLQRKRLALANLVK